jgi:ABC-2 type transport system ATP-binding protein
MHGTQTSGPAIEVRALSKRFGAVNAVDHLTFDVPVGSVTGFLGPNGAGKTTTLRMVLGLAVPSDGEARVLGVRYGQLEQPLAHVGAALETTGFHPGRTARAHLRIACLQGGLDPARVDAVLSLSGMTQFADMKVRGYSLGMKQRLAFAAALLGEPQVLVLDEPANGLDPAGVAWLRGFLRRFADGGGAVLVSSHLLSEIAEVADRVVVIDRGALIAEDTVARLVGAGGETVVVRSPDLDRLRAALQAAGGVLGDRADGALGVRQLPIERVGELASAKGIALHELRRETATLEEAFLALTGTPAASVTGPGAPPVRPDVQDEAST